MIYIYIKIFHKTHGFKNWLNLICLICAFFKGFIFLNNLYTHHGVWNFNPKIKGLMLYWLCQPGACGICIFKRNIEHIIIFLIVLYHVNTKYTHLQSFWQLFLCLARMQCQRFPLWLKLDCECSEHNFRLSIYELSIWST